MIILFLYRLDRLDRLPYLLERWKGPLCLSVAVETTELQQVDEMVQSYKYRDHLTLIFYIRKPFDPEVKDDNYFINFLNSTIIYQVEDKAIFPINLLRSLGINGIHTTHFMVTDIDLLPSSTLYNHFFQIPKPILRDERSAILYPAFVINKDLFDLCRNGGECNVS